MAETGPETPILKEETRREKAIRGLKKKFDHLRGEGVSFDSFRRRLRVQAEVGSENDPEFEGIWAQIEEVGKAQLEEGKGLVVGDIPRILKESMDIVSEGASPREREWFEMVRGKLPEIKAKMITRQYSPDLEKALEQVGRDLLGELGEETVRAFNEVSRVKVAKPPYPKPGRPDLPKGEKGWKGWLKYYGWMASAPAVFVCCASSYIFSGLFMRQKLGAELGADATKARWEKSAVQIADNLIQGSYPYSDIEYSLNQGGVAAEYAEDILKEAADLISMGEIIDGVFVQRKLDDIEDPKLIAHLIHLYGKGKLANLFNLNKIESSKEKRDLVWQHLQEFQGIELEKRGYSPPPRKMAQLQREVALAKAGKAKRSYQIKEKKMPPPQTGRRV
jgi:hypothetical protein